MAGQVSGGDGTGAAMALTWLALLWLAGSLPARSAALWPAPAADHDARQEVKLAFLVPARTRQHSPSRPNRHLLLHAFNYGLDRINQQQQRARFVGVQVETAAGNESDSIRQLVALISGGQVSAILGPQDTCHTEAKLASAFNVALLSYQCQATFGGADRHWASGPPPPPADNRWPGTFIQTKPPYWKIVRRVVTLVELMLSANNWYPQQLVLLYFKEHPQLASRQPANQSTEAAEQTPADAQLAIEAIQYRLIGELLELELARLSEPVDYAAGTGTSSGRRNRRPLVVLNWNTTFHYGFTRNPFVRLVRRHLAGAGAHQRAHQCAAVPVGRQPAASPDPNAIFIVVGHYYEHLGLMLALDEMNLLQGEPSAAAGSSVVVGVDTEQYDERYDSARFLHGLLMDQEARRRLKEAGGEHAHTRVPEQVAASMYAHYLGLVPARPSRMADFLAGMYAYLERSAGASSSPANKNQSNNQTHNLISSSQQRLMSARLFQLIRLPVEAFYLFDSLQLLGAYFASCLSASSLAQCSDGRQLTGWFRNRLYQTSVDHNDTCLDELAQAEGSYVLISRRAGSQLDSAAGQEPAGAGAADQDEFTSLVGQVGRFVTGHSGTGCGAHHSHSQLHQLQFQASPDAIDPIWHPLWCRATNSSQWAALCQGLWRARAPPDHREPLMTPELVSSCLLALLLLLLLALCLYLRLSAAAALPGGGNRKKLSRQHANGWFNATDERNFSLIVQRYLLHAPDALSAVSACQATNGLRPAGGGHMLEELHCHMFPFPSCKFVHWLTALHRLKEMMFQYQSGAEHCGAGRAYLTDGFWGAVKRLAEGRAAGGERSTSSAHAFFRRRHKGTASLRLLLNKYKALNQCFYELAQLSHESVVGLAGLVLSYEPARAAAGQSERAAHLLLERPSRGHLRHALAQLNENLELSGAGAAAPSAAQFRDLLVRSCLQQLLLGLAYLHQSGLQFHGELRATTCHLGADWCLKLAGFHAHHLRRSLGEYEQKSQPTSTAHMDSLIYSAPEVLHLHNRRTTLGTSLLRLADVYSFAFVAYELISGHEPWSYLSLGAECSSKLLVERVKVDANFRPPLSRLDKSGGGSGGASPGEPVQESLADSASGADGCPQTHLGAMKAHVIRRLIQCCWSQQPDRRPQSVSQLAELLESALLPMHHQQDQQQQQLSAPTTATNHEHASASLLSQYATQLEWVALQRKRTLDRERKRSRDLKLKMLPESLVLRLASGRLNQQHHSSASGGATSSIESQQFESVSVCVFRFLLKPLGPAASEGCIREALLPNLEHLNEILIQLDRLVDLYQRHIHLIDSPVDSSMRYLAYSGELLGCDQRQSLRRRHPQLVASFALQLIDLANRCQLRLSNCSVQVSCGLHCGPLLAGLMPERESSVSSCSSQPRYVLMGPGLALANCLEQSCLPQRIQISATFRNHLLQAQQQHHQHQRRHQQHQHQPAQFQDTGSLLFGGQQDYVIMKRDVKVCPASAALPPTAAANNHSAQSMELFWLVNGPRLTTGQSLLLSQFAL